MDNLFNTINHFLAVRTFDEKKHYDAVIVFGSALPYIGLTAYRLYQTYDIDCLVISGGKGPTTDYMKSLVGIYDDISEAEIIKRVIDREYYNDPSILLETESTNCGENLIYSMKLIPDVHQVLLIHDPLMQKRIDEIGKKEFPTIHFDSYAPFIPEIKNNEVVQNYRGLWDFNHYLPLMLGEMKRLQDNKEGYGPLGAGFIHHVEIPQDVNETYQILLNQYKQYQRQ